MDQLEFMAQSEGKVATGLNLMRLTIEMVNLKNDNF